ncbi:MAG TPA: dimethyl sulfoxide reductase anchor subunit [Casimicrobiaceae bacterium]|nr:dimethyl sulfoxide reductase anchor subunit [Casimicrobiaceae bacterium]
MRPAFSVVLLTTLIGAGQGLFLALFATEVVAMAGLSTMPSMSFFVGGGVVALALTGAGLIASIFHLGHPERGWRAAARWRTSWLSREVIVLPLFMAGLFAWIVAHFTGAVATGMLGVVTAVLALSLFLCTAMIYACLRLLKEWASPLTPLNYLLLGCASGTALAAAYAGVLGSPLAPSFAAAALSLTLAGAVTRIAALARNRSLRPTSTLQTAIGIPHPRIRQTAQGFMGGSFNTREFFHGATPQKMRAIKWGFLVLAFAVPALLLAFGRSSASMLVVAFVVQYVGLLAERWYFFAEANHPQNLYYQSMS